MQLVIIYVPLMQSMFGAEALPLRYWFVTLVIGVAMFLVAQYESWTLPASVMLSVLFAIGGALLWLWTAGYANDVYVQIGLVLQMCIRDR